MKKVLFLTLSLLLVLSMAIGFSSCKKKSEEPEEAKTYTLDTSSFNSVAVFGENLSLNGLRLVEDNGNKINVTKDMVSAIDTSSVGEKTFTITHDGQTFTVNYTVKYRVTFVIDGTETDQLVLSSSEIVVPELPKMLGKQFDSWSISIPNVLTSNIRVDAIYRELNREREDIYIWSNNGAINLEGYAELGSAVNVSITDLSGNPVSTASATVNSATNKLTYSISGDENVVIAISGSNVWEKSWRVIKTEKPSVTIANGENAVGVTLGGEKSSQRITDSSDKINFKYSTDIEYENANAIEHSGYLFVEALKLGVTKLTLIATNADNELERITVTQYVVVMPTIEEFIISNDATQYGIEDIWTVGRDNAERLSKITLLPISEGKIGSGFYENLSFSTNDARLTVSSDGSLILNANSDSSIVDVCAVFGYGDVTIATVPFQVRCVYDGYNVYSYNELWAETNSANPRPIVLQTNIKEDFSSVNYTTMMSTYDLTYHKNVGTPEESRKIKVLLQFKNDLYGNGYEINAHNATLGTFDSTGKPTDASIFRGPVPMVAVSESDGSAITYGVQDNVAFAVYDDVTINNVLLKNCELESYEGKIDLHDLEYVGTTVEVFGTNVTIEYSRLMNGRTLLRVFGDDEDPNKKITVYVTNTLLKTSREFSVRIGSNRFYEESGVLSPYLPGDTNGNDYNSIKDYGKKGFDTAAYDDKYINTFVTFSDVVFEDAGIFAVAIDSHFAGPALAGLDNDYSYLLNGWTGLAKTSYGAKVTFENDVRLYTWKAVDEVDSSIVIKCDVKPGGLLPDITFDIADVVKSLVAVNPAYSNLLYNYGGVDYVHSGVIIFGGGKNYSIFENNIPGTNQLANFSIYEVDFVEIGKQTLKIATGDVPFRFAMFDGSSTFTYADQIADTDRYDCLFKK